MSERARTFSPGDRICIEIAFVYEGGEEIESVEAVFCREGSDEEIVLLGDARREPSGGERPILYTARLEGRIDRTATPGEYRCVRLSAHDQFDDDRDFADDTRLNLVIRVERSPHRLEVTASDFV
jgi:hypothetical protein